MSDVSNQLEHLIGLCDEISALARVGIPLEESLFAKNRSQPGKWSRHWAELSAKLQNGTSLADAVRNDPLFPPVFAAVVEAGIVSGDLSGSLDSISQAVRSLRDARNFLFRLSICPMILFTALWIVFSVLFLFLGPRFAAFFESYGKTTLLFDSMKWAGTNVEGFILVASAVPLAAWGLFFLWSFVSSRQNTIQSTGRFSPLGWIPWVGEARNRLQQESFTRILALLVRASQPLDRSILIAAKACNDRYWSRETEESLQRRIREREKNALPKSQLARLIDWSLGVPNQQMLLEGLDLHARISRTRAEILLSRCERFLPVLFAISLSLAIAACYFLTVFWPYIEAIRFLAEPLGNG